MKQLFVLDLSATNIESLPKSISVLVNLSALILKECPRLRGIDPVQCLKKLRFLNMRESGIIEMPEGMVHFTGLVYFNISYTFRLQKIPARFIAQFRHLEDLEMNQSFYLEGLQNAENIIEELEHLKSLNNLSLDLQTDGLSLLLEKHCNWNNLTSFYLRVGSIRATLKTENVEKKEGRIRELERRGKCLDITGDATCGRLVKYANKLCVYQNRELRSISQLGLDNLECVEECWVWDCEEMEYIITFEVGKKNTYPHLQLLHLENLPKLESIFSYPYVVANPSLFNLRKIYLCKCNKIRFVFEEAMISQLGCLEELEVCCCGKLITIIDGFSETDGMCLPKLRCISLSDLATLYGLWPIDLSLPSLVEIKIRQCSILRPSRLTSALPPTLRVIEADESWWKSLTEDEVLKLSMFKPSATLYTDSSQSNKGVQPTNTHASSSH